MPGTKASGRPGGNPDLVKHQFKSDRPESCTERVCIRITATAKTGITQIDGWRDLVRDAIDDIIARHESSS